MIATLTSTRIGTREVLYCFENLGRKMTSHVTNIEKIPIAPALLIETMLHFQRKIEEFKAWHKVSEDLIINFDPT